MFLMLFNQYITGGPQFVYIGVDFLDGDLIDLWLVVSNMNGLFSISYMG